MERDHELHPQSLAEGIAQHEPLQLSYDCLGLAQIELRGQQLLEREYVKLLQTTDLGLRELFVANVDEGGSPPKSQGGLERANPVNERLPDAPREQSLESPRVELLVVDRQDVPAAGRLDQRMAEQVSQARDEVVERSTRCGWSLVAPEIVDQLVGHTHLPRMQKQRREKRADELAFEWDAPSVSGNLDRPKDEELKCDPAGRSRQDTR